MSIETIPAHLKPISPRTDELNPDLDPETLRMAVAYSYSCTHCSAQPGEACITVTVDSDPTRPPKRARFPHATRGTDYIKRAVLDEALDRSAILIREAVDKVVAQMVAEAEVVRE